VSVDTSTAKSQSGWIIFYTGCPISWASKLKSQVALSTTEAEYIAMSQSLCDVIPIMNLLQEMREQAYQVICTKPHMYFKVFEDPSGALELNRLPKLRPRTKHINVCYHHFCEHVRKGLIKIFPILKRRAERIDYVSRERLSKSSRQMVTSVDPSRRSDIYQSRVAA
jgi:hypothetical protein